MTEEEWWGRTPADLGTMLTFLTGRRASTRKVWLFACACCRGVWPLHTDPRSRAAVEAAERYADGLVTVETLEAAGKGALDAIAAGGGTSKSTCGTRRHCHRCRSAPRRG